MRFVFSLRFGGNWGLHVLGSTTDTRSLFSLFFLSEEANHSESAGSPPKVNQSLRLLIGHTLVRNEAK